MTRKLTLVFLSALLVIAAVPGIAVADEGPATDKVYLSLGDSLAAGSLADSGGTTVYPSNKSYTDRLYRKLDKRIDDLEHVKLGCDGEKTTDMITGAETKCAADYSVNGTQLAEAVRWLTDPGVEVVLVTIDIGANDVNNAAGACNFDPGCTAAAIPAILNNVGYILATIRGVGYTGPIVGMNYYNPNVAASIGYFAGAPGPIEPNPNAGFAVLTDLLAQGFNGGLAAVYGAFGVPVADVYGAFASGDFADDGGRYQKKGNDVADNAADAVCRLTYMCPKDSSAKANIHPNKKGYKVMAKAFWVIIREFDL